MKTLARIIQVGLFASAFASFALAQTPPAPPVPTTTSQRAAPLPGSEALVRGAIDRDSKGPMARQLQDTLGALKSLVFKKAGAPRWDVYTATFDKATREYWIELDATGRMRSLIVGQPDGPSPVPVPLDDAALGDYVRAAMDRMDFSGAILIARDGKPVFTAARGLADREQNIPNTLDTRFRVGSMNKMMTATAILQLVQAGKVKLDAPVGTYLKDYPNKELANTVTVHHLLTHTGGAGDIFGPQFTANRLNLKTLKDYVALYGSRAPEFAAGDNNRYANYGFILLGRIVEEVSGQTYPDYLRDHIFEPAGMTRTGFEPENVAVEGRAKGYAAAAPGGAGPVRVGPGQTYSSATDTLPWSGTSAGGGYSTVGDFLAFANALTSNKLLDAKHTALLTTKKVSNGYAYGFNDYSNTDMRMVGHGGGAPGMNGDLRIIGNGKAVVVALSNISPPGIAGPITAQTVARIKLAKPDGTVAELAQGPATTPPATDEQRVAAFKGADKKNEGRLDKAGFRTALQTLGLSDQFDVLFAQFDANRDGFVSANEVKSLPPPRTTPTPGLEPLARRIIEGDAKGQPALDIMSPGLAQAAENQRDNLMKGYARSGPLKTLTFQGPSPGGGDTYIAVFEYNTRNVSISLGADGKVAGFVIGPPALQNSEQLKASFKRIDTDADGKLDKTEYKSMLTTIGFPEMFDSLFATIDDDKDGVLTAKEYEAHPQ